MTGKIWGFNSNFASRTIVLLHKLNTCTCTNCSKRPPVNDPDLFLTTGDAERSELLCRLLRFSRDFRRDDLERDLRRGDLDRDLRRGDLDRDLRRDDFERDLRRDDFDRDLLRLCDLPVDLLRDLQKADFS